VEPTIILTGYFQSRVFLRKAQKTMREIMPVFAINDAKNYEARERRNVCLGEIAVILVTNTSVGMR